MTPDELVPHFLKRLKEQTEAHHGGNKWIGTHGTSPTGHSGTHPGGMRVGGESRNKSAIKVAMERRYRDYSQSGPDHRFADRRSAQKTQAPSTGRSEGSCQYR